MPVNHSAGPFAEGCEPTRLISIPLDSLVERVRGSIWSWPAGPEANAAPDRALSTLLRRFAELTAGDHWSALVSSGMILTVAARARVPNSLNLLPDLLLLAAFDLSVST